MRVYLPCTLPELARARDAGKFGHHDGSVPAHAVTPAIREWYVEGELEELEYAVMTEAAEASLLLLAADPHAPRRRVVVAADAPDAAVAPGTGSRSAVVLSAALPLSAVVSVHVDEPDAVQTVQAAVTALPAAASGDDDALFLLDEAEARDLLWYDVTELGDLL